MIDKGDRDDSEYEISFYENLIQKKPDFIEALACLGDLYSKKERYHDGLVVDRKLALLRPEDPVIYYNLACSYSLTGNVEGSLENIKLAIEKGYSDFRYLEADQDLTNLRDDKRFKQYFSRIKRRKK